MSSKKMRGKAIDYGEVKGRVNLSLTPTAKLLLKDRVLKKGCKSLSDFVEKLARGEVSWD